jgi:predicted Rossmann fold nucleotide-binding protein DprA/Smf involved in DNA uptake
VAVTAEQERVDRLWPTRTDIVGLITFRHLMERFGAATAVHQRPLEAETIAVVAGVVDAIYPPENADLYAQITAVGLIIGEVRIGVTPQARYFPSRNRVIDGLSLGITVV